MHILKYQYGCTISQYNKGQLSILIFCIIDHLHARTKEFINTLIAVTSRLDAAVTGINVLNPMENQCCSTFKCMQ